MSGGIHARGMRQAFDAGRTHIAKINADRARVDFIQVLLAKGERCGITLTDLESSFAVRIVNDHSQLIVPNIFSGDCNIIDSLRRKYEARLNPPIKPIARAARTLP